MFLLQNHFLKFFVIKSFQFIISEFVEFIEVFPVFITIAQIVTLKMRRPLRFRSAGYIMCAHCHYVTVVAGDTAQCRRNTFYNSCVYVRTFAGCNMDAHASTAEDQGSFKFPFCDFSADFRTDAMEHLWIFFVFCLYPDVCNGPALCL